MPVSNITWYHNSLKQHISDEAYSKFTTTTAVELGERE